MTFFIFSFQIASWLDESVDVPLTAKYQTPATHFLEYMTPLSPSQRALSPVRDTIVQMSTSCLFTVIRMSSGGLYWWGVMPYELRAKLVDKFQAKSQKARSNSANEISVGSYVSLKSLPLYSAGAAAISYRDGQARLGQVTESVFSLRDAKPFKFKVRSAESFRDASLVEMPPPPSPSGQEALPATGSLKRKKHYSSCETLASHDPDKRAKQENEYEEAWALNEVLFIEDSRSAAVLGKVIKVDNDYVLVRMMPRPSSDAASDSDSLGSLENCRIFQKAQLQLVRHSSSLKLPDFMQRTPKKIAEIGTVHSLVAHHAGFSALVSRDSVLFCLHYDLYAGKVVKERRLGASSSAFFGRSPDNLAFFTTDDPSVSKNFKYL